MWLYGSSRCSRLPPARAADSLAIVPGDFTLTGPAARQALVVEAVRDGQPVGEVTDGVAITSSDPKVLKVEGGVAVSVGNGRATITARAGGREAVVNVTVRDVEKPFTPSFRNHVQPILAAAGCSSGACHGAAAGKNGFKLSLRGYDDEGDWRAITRHALGRRINPADPARSLLLLKPTGAVPHKGGERVKVGSPEYQVLVDWIASGRRGRATTTRGSSGSSSCPSPGDRQAGRISRCSVLAPLQRRHARRTSPAGRSTPPATPPSAPSTTAASVKVAGHGEGPVTAWYLSRIATATVTVAVR